jgi:hypothetical protein
VDLLEEETVVGTVSVPTGAPVVVESDELAARRTLRGQIARLERDLADAFVTAYSLGGLGDPPEQTCRDPRLLDLGSWNESATSSPSDCAAHA